MDRTQPNILLVMADQLIPMLTGAYSHPVVKTPNLDRLVSEGVRFDAAYSPCPVCVPARACLTTGLYTSRNEVFDNGAELKSEFPTFFHYLRRAGYHCCSTGKMHWIGADQLHGLHERFTSDLYSSGYKLTPNWRVPQRRSHARSYISAGVKRWTAHRHFDEEVHFSALQWLRRWRKERPFCLLMSYEHPHEPFFTTQELWDLYEGCDIEIPRLPEDMTEHVHSMDQWLNMFHGVDKVDLMNTETLYNLRRAYYGNVTYIDNKIGELINTLEESDLMENTIVVFASDHGDMLAERGMVQKRSFYEFSSRIPLIFWAPKRWSGGAKVAAPVSLLDLYSTFVELGTGELPDGTDSLSLLPLLEGREDGSEREVISESHGQGVEHACFMLRRGDFKYIHVHTQSPQLYNIVTDPGEWSNLAGQEEYREIETSMRETVLSTFDLDEIERKALESQRRRLLIQECVDFGVDPDWDYQPMKQKSIKSIFR